MKVRDTSATLAYEPKTHFGATVLVVDDDESIGNILHEYLQDEGFRVLVARDGNEALRRAHAERPDVIISDVLMPRLDGYGLLEQVRRSPELSAIPLVLMSCIPPRAAQERPNAFLRKPFDLGVLLSLVCRMVPIADHSEWQDRNV